MKTAIELAKEAGVKSPDFYKLTVSHMSIGTLERLVELVRADEREACAKLVEPTEEHRRDSSWGYLGGEEGVELLDGLAADIRARKTR